MPLYNSKFTTSTEQAVAEAAAKAQRYAQDALRSASAAEVYYNQMVGSGIAEQVQQYAEDAAQSAASASASLSNVIATSVQVSRDAQQAQEAREGAEYYYNLTAEATAHLDDYARLDGADFTGQVTFAARPTVGGEELITRSDVGSTIEYSFRYTTYSALVDGGDGARKKGTIYFIPADTQSEANYYNEYMWVQDLNQHELIGSTQVDLSGYAKTADVRYSFSNLEERIGYSFTDDRNKLQELEGYTASYALEASVASRFSQFSADLARVEAYSADYYSSGKIDSDFYSIGDVDRRFCLREYVDSSFATIDTVYSKTAADAKFLPYSEASSLYASKSALLTVEGTANDAYSKALSYSHMMHDGMEFAPYGFTGSSYTDMVMNVNAIGAYSFDMRSDGNFWAGTNSHNYAPGVILFMGKFRIMQGVVWGLNALKENEDGSYGMDGYAYLVSYRINGYFIPSRAVLDLVDIIPQDLYS